MLANFLMWRVYHLRVRCDKPTGTIWLSLRGRVTPIGAVWLTTLVRVADAPGRVPLPELNEIFAYP